MSAMAPTVDAPLTRRSWRAASILNPKLVAGLSILAAFVLLMLIQPVLEATLWAGTGNMYDPEFGYDTTIRHPSGPSMEHWLGTSSTGRDVFSMLAFATRPTLVVALSAGGVIAVVALVLGAAAAVRAGWVDGVVSHFSDAMVLLPPLIAVYVLGIWRPSDEFGALHIGISFGLLYGLGPATATVRAAALSVVTRPFIDAAVVSGAGSGWIMTRHLMPHLYAHAVIQAMVGATGAVIADAFLGFRSAVGEYVGFGMMVYDGIVWADLFAGIADTPWWIMLAGAGGITLLAAAFYLVGMGIGEAVERHDGTVRR